MFGVPKDYKFSPEFQLMTLDKDGKNKGFFYGVETMSSQKFAQNYGGYPRSDIALINEQQNLSVAQSMLENLPDFGTQNDPNQGLNDIEIMLGVHSKYMQSPAEILPYLEKQIQVRNDRIAAIEAEKSSPAQSQQNQLEKSSPAQFKQDQIDNVKDDVKS